VSDHTTNDATRQPPPSTIGSTAVELRQVARSAEGLVSYQQSLDASTGRSDAAQRAASRRSALRGVSAGRRAGRGSRWRATLTDGERQIEVDSHLSRLRRCQRRVHAWASAIPTPNRSIRRKNKKINIGPRMVMLTLTYRTASEWKPNQVRDYLVDLRNLLGDRLLAYAWVLEMQQRGAPHYHILLYVQRGTNVPKPDAGMWRYGLSRRETAKSIFYICKYAGKAHQKEYQKEGLPIGARMFAVKIYLTDAPNDGMLDYRASVAPKWLYPHIKEAYSHIGIEIRWKRQKGGGWLIEQTGELFNSPWRIVALERID